MAHKPEQVPGSDADLMFQKSLYIRKSYTDFPEVGKVGETGRDRSSGNRVEKTHP